MGFLIAIVLGAALVTNIWASVVAKRTDVIETSYAPEDAAHLVDRCFGRMSWSRESGPGDLNYRRRVPLYTGPTVSVDVSARDASSVVEVWMSGWSGVLGVANYGIAGVLAKRKLAKRLLTDTTPRPLG